ncbi:MAG: peptidoglycan DD-metalloendopeptidase family protein [Gammaproteobacteria bacterium]|nr:peptidoglycan DD-metalloendopeptidase family protein [Gammaproteobacteria bacterium]
MCKALILIVLCFGAIACTTYQQPPVNTTKRFYIVKEHDNFYSIAFAYEITVEQLKAANPWLSPSSIAPGMRLRIPAVRLPDQVVNTSQPTKFIWPLKSFDVSSEFGYRYGSLHAGIDLRAARGTDIHAAAAGRVVFSGTQDGYGHLVILDHGTGLQTVYAHNDRNHVAEGQLVKQGQVIGSVGRTGNASGYHVHFEFRRRGKAVNPADYLN